MDVSYITAAVAARTWTGDPALDLLLSLQPGPLKAEVPITCSVPAVLLLAFPDNLLPPGINLDLLRQGRPGVYQSRGSSSHLWTQGHSLHITLVSQASHIRFPALMALSQYLHLLQDLTLHLHGHMVDVMVRVVVHHSILEHQHQVPLELSHGVNASLGQVPLQGC